MMKSAGRSMAHFMVAFALVALIPSAFPVAAHAGNSTRPRSARPGAQLNKINPAFVITPKEATEWHALKAKGGPAFSGYIVVCPMGYSVRSSWGIPTIGRGLIDGEPGFENEKNLKLTVQELAYADTMNVFGLVKKEFNVDENRIFLTGHSMGGAGAYFYAARHPEIWAGVAPIAGGGIDDRYAPGEKVKNLPFLVMQGEKDLIVRAEASRASAAKMKELGIKHSYIEIPGADHEVWIRHNPANIAKIFEFFNSLSKEANKNLAGNQ